MRTAFENLLRPDRYPLSSRYDPAWVVSLDMGPHPLWQLEDLLQDLGLQSGQKVLDLGCGKGATSVFLAKEFDVDVVAFDLWVAEDELRANIEAMGVADRVTAVHGSVHELPFDDRMFDAIISVDAFEYFGTDVRFLPALLRVLKPAGKLGMTTPALRDDPYQVRPPAHVTDLFGWEVAAWHAPDWWATHWRLSGLVDNINARLQDGGRENWLIWSRALDIHGDGAVTRTLLADTTDQIGFALVTATKR
jgi:cyclopropane fatty-acyl-phospholipid synthase-like methyltransferase